MTINTEIERLKAAIYSEDRTVSEKAFATLTKLGGTAVIDFLISLLDQSDASLRNQAAMALMEYSDGIAVVPLWKAIKKKENENSRGTLVYALQAFDCSDRLTDLFDLLFYGNYEVKMGVQAVLDEQIFEFSRKDILDIQSKWEDLQRHPEKCPSFEKCKEEIQHYVEGFLPYLDE